MTPERYKKLNSKESGELTEREMAEGWHFCPEWDYLLTNYTDEEGETCGCTPWPVRKAKMSDRDKFEKWADENNLVIGKDSDGFYTHDAATVAYWAWQASRERMKKECIELLLHSSIDDDCSNNIKMGFHMMRDQAIKSIKAL